MTTIEPVRSGMQLRLVDGANQSYVFPLERSLIALGRMTPDVQPSPAHLAFPEPTVSRLHAVLSWEPETGTYKIHHRSQTNPTVVNNVQLIEPQLLKLGDVIAIGRLALVLEKASAPDPVRSEKPDAELTLTVWTKGGEQVLTAAVTSPVVTLSFGGRGTVSVAGDSGPEQQLSVPAENPSTLRFEITPAGDRTVEVSQNNSSTRVTPGNGAELILPLPPGAKVPLLEVDTISHDGYRIRLGMGAGSFDAGGSTISEDPAGKKIEALTLTFLNGRWKDATIAIPPGRGVHLPLGPGESPFQHPFPFTNVPSCIVTVAERDARVRARKVDDDQMLEIDGDLVFDGESVEMVSGSRLMLGEACLYWCDPVAHRMYSQYVLKSPEGEHPITKARVRLGTAAHCEIRFQNRDLAPVIGYIEFDASGPTYYHQCLTWSARVDGRETSTGLFAPIQEGSEIEAVGNFVLKLEKNPE